MPKSAQCRHASRHAHGLAHRRTTTTHVHTYVHAHACTHLHAYDYALAHDHFRAHVRADAWLDAMEWRSTCSHVSVHVCADMRVDPCAALCMFPHALSGSAGCAARPQQHAPSGWHSTGMSLLMSELMFERLCACLHTRQTTSPHLHTYPCQHCAAAVAV